MASMSDQLRKALSDMKREALTRPDPSSTVGLTEQTMAAQQRWNEAASHQQTQAPSPNLSGTEPRLPPHLVMSPDQVQAMSDRLISERQQAQNPQQTGGPQQTDKPAQRQKILFVPPQAEKPEQPTQAAQPEKPSQAEWPSRPGSPTVADSMWQAMSRRQEYLRDKDKLRPTTHDHSPPHVIKKQPSPVIPGMSGSYSQRGGRSSAGVRTRPTAQEPSQGAVLVVNKKEVELTQDAPRPAFRFPDTKQAAPQAQDWLTPGDRKRRTEMLQEKAMRLTEDAQRPGSDDTRRSIKQSF